MSDENEVFLKELSAMRTEFEHLNDIFIDFGSDWKTASWTLIWCGIATPLFERRRWASSSAPWAKLPTYPKSTPTTPSELQEQRFFRGVCWGIQSNVCHWTQVSAESQCVSEDERWRENPDGGISWNEWYLPVHLVWQQIQHPLETRCWQTQNQLSMRSKTLNMM